MNIASFYQALLNGFPPTVRPWLSLVLVALIAYSVFKIVKKQFIFLIILIVLLPGAWPIVKTVWFGIVATVNFLLKNR